MKKPRNILITGASSGIGAALAVEYAAQGAKLYLTGRSLERLQEVAAKCPNAELKQIDITDATGLNEWISSLPELDLVIANAGISGGMAEGVDNKAVREIFATNIDGVINTVLPAIEKMEKQGRGQIAIMASVAGLRGLPPAPAYSASKACVLAYAQALRGSLHRSNISVTAICPGYVKTPLTDKNKFYMPFLMTPERAAKIIVNGLAKNKSIIGFPKRMYYLVRTLASMPVGVTDPIFRILPKK